MSASKPRTPRTPGFWKSVDWEDLIPRLLVFAAHRLKGRRWHGVRNGLGDEKHDIVYEAIVKTMDGTRTWKEEKQDLYTHLIGVINSTIDNLLNGKENNVMVRISEKDYYKALDTHHSCTMERDPRFYHDPLYQRDLSNLLKYLGDIDPLMKRLAELILIEGHRDTPYLSYELNIDTGSLNNLKKRLRRALECYANPVSDLVPNHGEHSPHRCIH